MRLHATDLPTLVTAKMIGLDTLPINHFFFSTKYVQNQSFLLFVIKNYISSISENLLIDIQFC